MKRSSGLIVVLALLLLGSRVPAAQADLAQTLEADLRHIASGVPGAQVTVGPPVGDETALGPSAAVVMRVIMAPPRGEPLGGILVPPGLKPIATTTTPKLVLWDFAAIQAAKHALASGSALDAVSITRNYLGEPPASYPSVIEVLDGYQPPPTPGTPMAQDEVKERAKDALPIWAAGARVEVIDDYAGERVVSAELGLPPQAFAIVNPHELLGKMADYQYDLALEGARIGRVVVEVSDPATGQPLYAGAADSFMNIATQWYSPLVQGRYEGSVPDPQEIPTDPAEAQAEVEELAQSITQP